MNRILIFLLFITIGLAQNPTSRTPEASDYVRLLDTDSQGWDQTLEQILGAGIDASFGEIDMEGGYILNEQAALNLRANSTPNAYLWFDMDNDAVTVSNAAVMDDIFDHGGTVAVWVYIISDGESSTGRIISKTDWYLSTTDETGSNVKLTFTQVFTGTNGTWRTNRAEIPLNEWSYLVVTYDNDVIGNDPILYLNAIELEITETSTPTGTRTSESSDNLIFGGDGSSGSTLDGSIPRVSIHNEIYSAEEIKALKDESTPYRFLTGADTEFFITSGDRDFGSATEWTTGPGENAFGTYNESGDLSLLADSTIDYAFITFTNIGTDLVKNKRYRFIYKYTETIAGFEFILSGASEQNLGVAVAGTQEYIDFTAEEDYTTTDEFQIHATTSDTAKGDFDDFSFIQIGVVEEWDQASLGPNTWYGKLQDLDGTISGATHHNGIQVIASSNSQPLYLQSPANVEIQPDGDYDDYITFSTGSDLPSISGTGGTDATNALKILTDDGHILIAPADDLILDPGGNNVNPGLDNVDIFGQADTRWSDGFFNKISLGDTTTGAADAIIYFADDASVTQESIKWDDGNDRFEFSDDIYTALTINAEDLSSTDDADIADNLTAGDIIIDEASGVLSYTGANEALISTGTEDLKLDPAGGEVHIDGGLSIGDDTDVGDDNLKVVGTSLLIGGVTIQSGLTIAMDDPFIYYDPSTGGESEWWTGTNHDEVGDDNDNWEVRQSATPGTNVELTLQPNGNLGLGTTTPIGIQHTILSTTQPVLFGGDRIGSFTSVTFPTANKDQISKTDVGTDMAEGDLVIVTGGTGATTGLYRAVTINSANLITVDRDIHAEVGDITDGTVSTAKDVIVLSADGRIMRYAHDGTPIQIGGDTKVASSHSLGAEDVLIGGKLEVKGTLWADASIGLSLGNSSRIDIGVDGYYGRILVKADDGLHFMVSSGNGISNNNFIFGSNLYWNSDYDHEVPSANPTIIVHSGIDPDVSNNQWGSFANNQENFVFSTGANVGTGSAPTINNNGILFDLSDLTSSGTANYGVKIARTLNDNAAGGSDLFTGLLMDITGTDVTGWDNTYLMDLQVSTVSKFSVDFSGNGVFAGGLAAGTILSDDYIAVLATKKMLLDGTSGHTYWTESADDVMKAVVGTVDAITITESSTISGVLADVWDVTGDFTANTIASDGVLSGTTITASTGFALGDGDYIGITGNEILVFNAAGYVDLVGALLYIGGDQISVSADMSDQADVGMLDENEAQTGYWTSSFTNGVTATNPGVQGDNLITTELFEVSVVGTADDAVTLSPAVGGKHSYIINNGANSLEIWPTSGDDAGAGVDTAINLVAGANLHLVAYDNTNWETF